MYDREFPIHERPQPLLEWEEGDILGRCYRRAPEECLENVRQNRRLKYFERESDRKRVVTRLIPLADSLDRLLGCVDPESVEEDDTLRNWVKSLVALKKRLLSIMEREGLSPVESIGKTVDLDIHEVIEVRGESKIGKPVVVAEHQKGYLYDNHVVRDAQVVVERIPENEIETPVTQGRDGLKEE